MPTPLFYAVEGAEPTQNHFSPENRDWISKRICANDFVAYDALQALRKLGKSVPRDVMLCGFDDAPEFRMVVPALTTVHIHTQIMAFSAAQLLITRIREPSLDYCRVYIQTDLIRRESTGTVQAN